MACELDLSELNDNLDPFGIECPDISNITEKLDGLCRTYRKTTEAITDDLISVMNNENKKTIDSQILVILEQNLEEEAKKAASKTPKSAKKPARVPLAERTGFTLSSGPGDVGDGEKSSNHLNIPTPQLAKLEGHFLQFSPFSNSPANLKFLQRADAGSVVSTIRGKEYVDKGLKATKTTEEKLRIVSKQPKILYGGDKSSMVIEAKAKRMGELAAQIQETFEEIVDWGNPLVPSVDVVYTYGQVIHDDTREEKFGEQSVALMINDEDGTMVRLDFSKMLDDITLFPGQIVAVRGTNETGEEFQVDRIFTAAPLPPSKLEVDTTKEIWFACGPYTAVDNCGYEHLCELLDKVVLEKPDLLILAGPFVDRRNVYLTKQAFTSTHDILLEDLLINIKGKLLNTKTEVIIQPSSSRDLCVPPIFPSAPFQVNRKKLDHVRKEIHFVPDPCVIRFGESGLEIAVTSSEPIQALSNGEFHRSANQENCDRIARLSGHLLTQQSMYPLEPTDIPSSMGDVLEVCRLTSTPHIIFAPSKLVPSAKSVNGCVFVNSSSLAKGPTGNYVKMSVNVHAGELQKGESVADYSNIQIMKI